MLRTKIGAGILALGLATAVWPVSTASASVATVATVATVAKSSLCTAYKGEQAKEESASTSLEKVMASGKWSKIQKAMLSTFGSELNTEKQFIGLLNGASSQVKAAAAVALKLDANFKTIVASSKSLTQFQTKITAAESAPKVEAALKVLTAFSEKTCPTTTPSS
jgi:hypothetical protein